MREAPNAPVSLAKKVSGVALPLRHSVKVRGVTLR